MAMRAPFIPTNHPRRASLASALALAILGQTARAADDTPELPFSGASFDNVVFPIAPQRSDVALAADRAAAWTEGGVRRVFLDRDAVVTIGPYTFRAERASIWIDLVETDAGEATQIAVFFERVRDAAAPPGATPGLAQTGDRLLVTGVLVDPSIDLKTDLLERRRPDDAKSLARAERRLAEYLATITGFELEPLPAAFEMPRPLLAPTPAPAAPRTGARPTPPPGADPATTRTEPTTVVPPFTDTREDLPPAPRTPPRLPSQGSVSFFANDVRLVPGENGASSIVLLGGVAVQATSTRDRQSLQFAAERAVVFLNENADPSGSRFDTGLVSGIYVEGDVGITNGDFHFRGDRVFFDPATFRALALDAVFWTFDEERGMPLYFRADAIRQEAENQWTAENATFANVAFADPHFSIGAQDITITRSPNDDGVLTTTVDAQGVAFKTGDASIISVGGMSGDVRPSPLREVRFERQANSGLVSTRWDLHALAGNDAPPGNRADLLLDGYFERGPAVGADFSWSEPDMAGSTFAYYIYDSGTDRLTSGAEIGRDDDSRGMVLAENVWQLTDEWTFFVEGTYISDEAFVDSFFEYLAETRREFVSSIAFRRIRDNSVFALEARGTFNDFISNEYLLQSQGYAVEKLPEFRYSRVAEPVGILSYTVDLSASRMNLSFNEPRLRDFGFDTSKRAEAGFGLQPDDRLSDELSAEGYTESSVLRFDMRHEVEMPLSWGAFNIVPFAVGRLTAWDTDFRGFQGTDNGDQTRLWGSAGTRIATSLVRVDNSVKSDLFDLDRIRHIIEPSATFWVAGTNIDPQNLPVYDESIEGITEGTVVRAGARQTWQTMRGPEGRERSVDWLVLDTNYVWSSGDAPIESPFGRFIESRPERSNLGEFIQGEAAMLLTDAVTIVGDAVYNLDDLSLARFSTGMLIDHGYGFSTFTEYRFLNNFDSTFINLGAEYELTRKYAAAGYFVWDFDRSDIQRFGTRITRRFPQWTLTFELDLDNISDNVGIGVALRPAGFAGDTRERIFTYDEERGVVPNAEPSRITPTRLNTGPFGGDRR